MSIIEILDSENIKSNLESWIDERRKFMLWYVGLGNQPINIVQLEKASLKIPAKTKVPDNLAKALREFYGTNKFGKSEDYE